MGCDYNIFIKEEKERKHRDALANIEKLKSRVDWLKGALFYHTNKIYSDEEIDDSLNKGKGI